MILHTTSVEHLGDYRLWLSFNNGESGEVDLIDHLHGEVFEPLRDKELFATVRHDPIGKTAAWANGTDLAPEYLIGLLRQQSKKAA